MAIWMRDNHILTDADGHPLDCPWCPCDPTTCAEVMDRLAAQCEQAGAYYLRQTGYLYSTQDPSCEIIASVFHWISCEYDQATNLYICRLNYLSCDCEQAILATLQTAEPPLSPAGFGYAFLAHEGACDGDCATQIAALIAQAVTNGWALHGNGVFARRTSADAQYAHYAQSVSTVNHYLVCADTGSSWIIITCDCAQVERGGTDYGLLTPLDYPNVCSCFDMRELLIDYPDVFGVEDISFGQDTVYTYTSGSNTYTESTFGIDHPSTPPSMIDYRNMYVIFAGEAIESEALHEMYVFYAGMYNPYGYTTGLTFYGDVYFDGHLPPFSTSAENAVAWPHASSTDRYMSFPGKSIRWNAVSSNYDRGNDRGSLYGSYYSQTDAQTALDTLNASADKYGAVSYSMSASYATPSVSGGPTYTEETVEGCIEYNSDSGLYDVYMPCIRVPAYAYNLNVIQTNLGLIINGRDGYHESVELIGFAAALSHFTTTPSTESVIAQYSDELIMCTADDYSYVPCPEGTIVSREFTEDAFNKFAFYTITMTFDIHASMGGCREDDWWNAITDRSGE